jgi:molybdate transport system substrate-binding protein
LIATASSFRPALQALLPELSQICDTSIQISSGSTGALLVQAGQGAPFDLLISADPSLQVSVTGAKAYPPFARSPLAYWQPQGDSPATPVAVANPDIAPFGRAAIAAMKARAETPDLVRASNAAQAFSFVHTGAAPAGYVPLPLLIAAETPVDQYQIIDPSLYPPVRLQLIVLRFGPVQTCLVAALHSEATARQLASFGYQLP